jgi:2'-5' RNA ligase
VGEERSQALQRLADFHVTLLCPADLPEEQLDLLCEMLEQLDFRSKIQGWLEWYTRARKVLREVKVRVDE